VESTPPNQGRIQFLGRFVCPFLEQDFRRKYLPEDLRLAGGCSVVVLVGSVFYLLNGYQLYGTSAPFLILLTARTTIMAASVSLIIALRRCTSPAQADRSLLVWCLIVAAGNLTSIATRSTGNFGHALMSLGIPLVTYCILPLPLFRQLLLAIPFCLAALLAAFASGVDSRTLLMLGSAYLVANWIGSFASWQLNHRRRQVYLTGVRETELRSELEQALAEIKTLRGLLPICAWCKRIRDAEQAWHSVESYVQAHSYAEFSHSICDHCMEEQIDQEAIRRGRR
jgi:hypothetical protein